MVSPMTPERRRTLRNRLPYLLLVVGSIVAFHVHSDDVATRDHQRDAQIQQNATLAKAANDAATAACTVSHRDWNAFQKIIATTRNPPSLKGRTITPVQRGALDAYAQALTVDVGPKPDC